MAKFITTWENDMDLLNYKRCGTCQFYNRDNETTCDLHTDEPLHEEDYEAPCRRFPPVRDIDASYDLEVNICVVRRDLYTGPIVQNTAWCGEWKRFDPPIPDRFRPCSTTQQGDYID